LQRCNGARRAPRPCDRRRHRHGLPPAGPAVRAPRGPGLAV